MSIYKSTPEYYVYGYLREDGSPYYVGKGKKSRYIEKNKTVRVPRDRSRIVFYARYLSEESALNIEKYLIQKYGRKIDGSGILRNLTTGGEGTSGTKKDLYGEKNPMYGKKHKKSTKLLISEKAKSRPSPRKGVTLSEETKKKISEKRKGQHAGEKNPMYGKNHSVETKENWSRVRSGKRPMNGQLVDCEYV